MRPGFLPLAAASLAGSTAIAAASVEAHYSKTYKACMSAAQGSTMPTLDCMATEHDVWDKEMNQLYVALISSRSAPDRIRLRDEQRAWLRRETATCDHAGDDDAGGSLQRVEINQCFLDETIRRTLYLRRLR